MNEKSRMPTMRPQTWTWALWIVTVVILIALYDDLPARIPVHWNIAGEVDDYGGKLWAVGGMFLLSIVLNLGMPAVARIDPWTLASERVWTKTHRFAAWLWSAAGLIGVLSALLLPLEMAFVAVVGSVCVAAAVAVVYSFAVYRNDSEGR